MLVGGTIKVFEEIFQDLRVSIETATQHYVHGDPRKDALYSMQAAIDYMNIPSAVRKALNVPHPKS